MQRSGSLIFAGKTIRRKFRRRTAYLHGMVSDGLSTADKRSAAANGGTGID
jgi:hypothetical protein